MNKYIHKDVGIKAISSYKRASNITDKIRKESLEDQMRFFLEQKKEKYYLRKLTKYEKLLQ